MAGKKKRKGGGEGKRGKKEQKKIWLRPPGVGVEEESQ